MKERGERIEIVEDMFANNGERLFPELQIYDSIIIKGLVTDRAKNSKKDDYTECDDIEGMGFISYIPKYLGNMDNIRTKEEAEELLNKEFKTVIFRAYCQFRTGIKLFVKKEEKDLIFYDNSNSFNHVAVFECEMEQPSKFTSMYKNETYTEWIAKHNFGKWQLIDMDNWMKGNSYFKE